MGWYTPLARYTPHWDQVHPPPGGTPSGTLWNQVHSPDQVHPQTRYTPFGPGTAAWDQVHPKTRYTHNPGPGISSEPGTPPQTRYIPWTRYTPLGRYTPQAGTPPTSSACWEIQTTSGRYTSYWNAFLFYFIFLKSDLLFLIDEISGSTPNDHQLACGECWRFLFNFNV